MPVFTYLPQRVVCMPVPFTMTGGDGGAGDSNSEVRYMTICFVNDLFFIDGATAIVTGFRLPILANLKVYDFSNSVSWAYWNRTKPSLATIQFVSVPVGLATPGGTPPGVMIYRYLAQNLFSSGTLFNISVGVGAVSNYGVAFDTYTFGGFLVGCKLEGQDFTASPFVRGELNFLFPSEI